MSDLKLAIGLYRIKRSETVKALSLKQPYAELILQGRKTIELRKWNTPFRGEFCIHASKQVDANAMEAFGFTNLPTGGIVGKATLVTVKHYPDQASHEKDKKAHLASTAWGNYGFILKNPQRIQYTPYNGKLGFWDAPDSVISKP